MTKQLKRRCIIYIAGVAVYAGAVAANMYYILDDRISFGWYLFAYLLIGFESFRRLTENIMQKRFLTEYTLIVLATIGALGIERYKEGVFVMLLFELGMLFEAYTTDNTKREIQGLIDIRPEHATRLVHGREFKVDPATLKPGHLIIIKPGERIPADAMITFGISDIDTKTLTGEVKPLPVGASFGVCDSCFVQVRQDKRRRYVHHQRHKAV